VNVTRHIAIIGDRDPTSLSHRAIPIAIATAAVILNHDVKTTWIATDDVDDRIRGFDGLWCAPGTPYRSPEGALYALRCARMADVPMLATSSGFHYAVIEYARNVAGLPEADSAEVEPNTSTPVIAALARPLVGVAETVRIAPGSRLREACNRSAWQERFDCRFGLNPLYESQFRGVMRGCAVAMAGETCAVEVPNNRFYIATLFQPELAALAARIHPLVISFVQYVTEDDDAQDVA
jgi:CTP synthase (UTP-ammonia lyase)